jgi:signal transduction histidine kinase
VDGKAESPGQVQRRGRWDWIRGGAVAAVRGVGFCGLMLAGLVLVLALAGAAPFAAAGYLLYLALGGRRLIIASGVILPLAGVGLALIHKGALSITVLVILAAVVISAPLAPSALLAVRQLAVLTRRLCREWCAVPITAPYRPPEGDGQLSFRSRLRWLLGDPAGRRDALWLAVNGFGGWLLAAAPAGLVVYGLLCILGVISADPWVVPLPFISAGLRAVPDLALLAGAGILSIALGLWAAPRLLRGYGLLARSLLGPTGQTEMALRVAHLAQTRADTIDTGAAEMRRIERDLHDGAQARLVAMGMTLDAAEQMLEDNPAATRALLAEAREASARALAELRDLVRGIHPPVLADRGLAEAVRALALDLPLRVHYSSEINGRLPAPVESAGYFSVSELLANVSKHAHATRAWVDLRHDGHMLRIGVSDDGTGGADPARGTGLAGIGRRLAAFDGVLAVSSPPGGPTVVNMEIPCALSSPKTSSC